MKFKILESPTIRLRTTNAIPFPCIEFIKPFSNPKIQSCSYLDIIHQYRVCNGFKLRTIIYNVREAVTLISCVGSTRLVMQNMLHGSLSIEIDSFEPLSLNDYAYALYYLNTKEFRFTLIPGIHHLISLELSEHILQERQKRNESPIVTQWLEQYNSDQSNLYGQNFDLGLIKLIENNLIDSYITTSFEEELFGLKLSECFIRLIEDQSRITA